MEKKKEIDYVIFGVLCLGVVLATISLILPFVAVESFTVSSMKEIFSNVGQKLSCDDKNIVAQGACELIFLVGGLVGFVIGLVFSIIVAVFMMVGFLGVLGTYSATNYGGAELSFGFNSYSIIYLVFCGVSLVLAIAARITARKSY